MPPVVRRALLAPILLVLGAAACGDPFQIPPASSPTSDRIVILYALTGTPISTPSAFNIVSGLEVRTDRTPDFDFAIEFAPDSQLALGTTGATVAAVLPRGALGFGDDPGAQVVDVVNFDSLTLAPLDGYTNNRAVRIDSGDVVVVTSRLQGCNFGLSRHLYAKFRVDAVDFAQRRITTRMVINPNCGFRGLGPGVPTQ